MTRRRAPGRTDPFRRNAGAGRLESGPDPRLLELLYAPALKDDLEHVLPLLLQIDAAHVVMLAETGCLASGAAADLLRVNRELAAGGRPLPAPREHRGLYFLYEREYVERLGAQTGGAAHMARSRNDINATVTRLRLRAGLLEVLSAALGFCDATLGLAERHVETLTCGFTHLQPAQPTTLGHYLAGVVAALLRPVAGAAETLDRVALCPMGAASGFGTSFPIDRKRVAELLGFSGVVENSLDAVASRDYAVEALSYLAVFGVALTRLATDLQLWGSPAYGFLTWPDRLVSTSSTMPQKRNAYVFENVRGRAARPASALNAVLMGMKNTPFSNSVEVSAEATGPVWTAFDDIRTATELMELMVRGVEVVPERMAEMLAEWDTTMTALANHLVLQHGLSFRSAHDAVSRVLRELPAGPVGRAEMVAERLGDVLAEDSGGRVALRADEVRVVLEPGRAVGASAYGGGPASATVRAQLAGSRRRWSDLARGVETWRRRAEAADRLLETAIRDRIAIADAAPAPQGGDDGAG